jgi:TRAP-type C4-dicarboxylate transport system substrate-binding protein
MKGTLPYRAQQILRQAAKTAAEFRREPWLDDEMADRVLNSAHRRVVRMYPEFFQPGAIKDDSET